MSALEVERAAHAATVALSEFDRAGVTTVLQTVPALAQTLRELLAAVTTPTPPADDVREALAAVLDDSLLCWTYNGTHTVFHPTKGADAVLARFDVRPRGTVTETETEPAETYSVYGGQGLRRIASGLSREDAERVSRKFEIDCLNAGLTNPPGRIEREARS